MQGENKLTSVDWNVVCFSLASEVKYMHLNVKVMSLFTFLSSFLIFGLFQVPTGFSLSWCSYDCHFHFILGLQSLTKVSTNVILCPLSTNMSTKSCVSSLYFSKHVVCEFGLICMCVIASFPRTLNSYFLLVVLLVMSMSRTFSEGL